MGKPITARAVQALKPRAAPYEVRDPALTGAYVTVHPSGALSYVLRFRFNGAKRKLTVGKFDPLNGLGAVRAKAHAALADLAKARRDPENGVDPAAVKTAARRQAAEARRTAKAEADRARQDSVEHVVDLFTRLHLNKLRSGPGVARALQREVVGRWRGRRLADVTRSDVYNMLDEIVARGAPVRANRVAAFTSKLLAWATARGYLDVNPLAGGVERPTKEQSRKRALDDDELALVWRAAEQMGRPFGPVVQLLILSGQRLNEVAGMRWNELDFEKNIWTLPAERTKNKREHIVPLTPLMLRILRELPRIANSSFVFTTTAVSPISGFSRFKRNLDSKIAALNGGALLSSWRLHDLRRSTAAGLQKLGVDLIVTEKILNHASGSTGGIIGVYQVHDYAAEKRAALERWNSHVERIVSGEADKKVVPLHKR